MHLVSRSNSGETVTRKITYIAWRKDIFLLLYQLWGLRFHVRTIELVPALDHPNADSVLDVTSKARQTVAKLEGDMWVWVWLQISAYHCGDILPKNNIHPYAICKCLLAHAACGILEDLIKSRADICHLNICAFGDCMSDNLANSSAEHVTQHFWLVINAKYLPCSRTMIWCIRKLLANGQCQRIHIATIVTILMLSFLTSGNTRKTSRYQCTFILTRIAWLRCFPPCGNLTAWLLWTRNVTDEINHLFSPEVCATFLEHSQ